MNIIDRIENAIADVLNTIDLSTTTKGYTFHTKTGTIDVYDEMKSGVNATGTTPTNIDIPSQGSITATCDNSTTSRVLGFDYSLSIKKIPYYTIGSETPVEVKHINPIEYSAAVQIDVDDIFLASGFSFFEEGRSDKNLSFSIHGRGGSLLQTLTVPNASLVSEQINASAEGSVRLTLNYIGHS